ncbi:hypothetical protein CQA66_02190 [Helicobacter aurati]|uniref:Methyl-accepting chemotaxis protein n=1 Tax=Helicobacter aurati TaxID=137778 RepID=A0A3D8J858_9HELI|nr:cache domain-containing protein [Helicobacter aurati]RDU73064.1 hypothetical protein CQA66_02190 [Helicobacter aurati]
MVKKYRFGLASKMRLIIFATIFITIGILCAVVLRQVKKTQIESAMDSILLSAKYNASNANALLNSGLYPFKVYASSLSHFHALEYSYLIDQVLGITHESDNTSYGFLYLIHRNSDAPENIRIDDGLMIFASQSSSNILRVDREILNLPAVQQAIQTRKEQLGVPMRIRIEGREIQGSVFAFPIINKQREVIGVLGGILDYEHIANVLLATTNVSYPDEARILIAQDGTIITSNSNNKDKIIGLNLRDLVKMSPHLESVVAKVLNNEEMKAAIRDTTGQKNYAAHANINIPLFDVMLNGMF